MLFVTFLFDLYSQRLTQEALGRALKHPEQTSRTVGQVTRTVKYADDLVLLVKEEAVLQSMTERLTEIESCSGMEMDLQKN